MGLMLVRFDYNSSLLGLALLSRLLLAFLVLGYLPRRPTRLLQMGNAGSTPLSSGAKMVGRWWEDTAVKKCGMRLAIRNMDIRGA